MEDIRLGVLAATIARAAGAKGVKPADFMLRRPADEPDQADEVRALDELFGVRR